MSEAERRALGQTRRLVFQNIANGIAPERVREALKISQLEVDQALDFVRKKIAGRLAAERQPPIPADDVRLIRFNRLALLGVLAKMGDLDLSTELTWVPGKTGLEQVNLKVTTQKMDHIEVIEGAQARMRERYGR